jgi:uncharacterized protein YdhG (YjbR/CyaY superfamily)
VFRPRDDSARNHCRRACLEDYGCSEVKEEPAMERGFPADTVDEYFAAIPEAQRAVLEPVRRVILDTIPDGAEHIGYQIPIFDYRRRGLIGLSVAHDYCSLHLMSPPLARELAGQLTEGDLVGATLHFTPEAPLSEETVRMIVRRRIAEVDGR